MELNVEELFEVGELNRNVDIDYGRVVDSASAASAEAASAASADYIRSELMRLAV